MSMIYYLLGVSPTQIGILRTTPPLVGNVVSVALSAENVRVREDMMDRMSPEQRKQFEASQAASKFHPAMRDLEATINEARRQVTPMGPLEQVLSLEKSWHMMHYLFTGHVGPANAPGDLLMTGEELGEDVGYGPARIRDPESTRKFSEYLDSQNAEHLKERVSLLEMSQAGVYAMPRGRGSAAEFERELRDEIGLFLPRLCDYVRTTSSKGNGLLTWVS